jgi:hypothetical protein
VIVYDAPDLARAARINPEKVALLRSVATVATSPAEVAELAAAALAHPGTLSAARRAVARELFHDPGRATVRAVNLLRGLLQRAPARTAASGSALERELT